MNREVYFDRLFESLEELRLIPPVDSSWRLELESDLRRSEIPAGLIEKLREEYGIAFLNVILINCRKNFLLCRQFSVSADRTLFNAALSFTLLGCVLDFMLDSPDEAMQYTARKKLSEGYCSHYFIDFGKAQENTAADRLFETISQGLYEIWLADEEKYRRIVNMIRIAAESEVNVLKDDCTDESIVCKSLEFTRISAEILLAKYDLTDAGRVLIDSIGYSFALIDDLCDSFEDDLIGQANLVNKSGIADETAVVGQMCEKLRYHIAVIKERATEELYDFIFCELSEWPLSCADIRSRIWEKYG